MINFKEKSLRELKEMVEKSEISIEELFFSSQEKIKERNKELNIFLELFSFSKPKKKGALFGIPFALKDNILLYGKRAGAASKILENYYASYNAKVSELLLEEGAIPVGRVNMDEMAMGSSTENSAYGPTKNPLDPERVPGGSSGGSAAAVAAGMVPFALGSDTGGSIRQPAAFCGVVGLKPSYGSVSRRGLIAMASSLDVIGPITNSVEDAEYLFNILSQNDSYDQTFVPHSERLPFQKRNKNNRRIGVPRSFLEREGIDPSVLKNFFTSLDLMKQAGYEIIDIEIPSFEYALAVYYILQPAEVSSNMARFDGIRYGLSVESEDLLSTYKNTRKKGFGSEVKRRIVLGNYVLSSGYHDEYYYRAQKVRSLITKEVRDIFSKVDIIASPTSPSLPFRFGERKDPLSLYLEDIFTVPYNLSGNPAISIPSGKNEEGLFFAIHFSAPLFCEKKLFEVGKDFERVRGKI